MAKKKITTHQTQIFAALIFIFLTSSLAAFGQVKTNPPPKPVKRVVAPSPPVYLGTATAQNLPSEARKSAPDDWEIEPLFLPLADFIINLENSGYHRTADFVVKSVQDDQSWTSNFEMQAGKNYVIFAVCDFFCPALNVHVYDETNDLMAFHKDRKSKPAIYFTPRRTGTFKIKTTIVACRQEPCRAAVSVYGK